jgi:hypothetical protein
MHDVRQRARAEVSMRMRRGLTSTTSNDDDGRGLLYS